MGCIYAAIYVNMENLLDMMYVSGSKRGEIRAKGVEIKRSELSRYFKINSY